MKKTTSIFAILVVVSMLLAACGAPPAVVSTPTEVSVPPTEAPVGPTATTPSTELVGPVLYSTIADYTAATVGPGYDLDTCRKIVRRGFRASKGCNIELMLKEMMTIENDPQRLMDFARMAREEANYSC